MMEYLEENHKRYIERINVYKKHGYDIDAERSFLIDKSKPIYGKILELGTGKGYMTMALAKAGFKFTSIDISEEEQRFARLNIEYLGLEKYVDFKISDAEKLNFEDGSFNVIFAVNVLHHLVNPYKVIDEIIRILSDDGKIILSDFNQKGLEIIEKIHADEGRVHEAGKPGIREISTCLRKKGFIAEECESKLQDILITYKKKNG